MASVSLSRSFRDFPEAEIQRDTETMSYSLGADAKFGAWKLSGYGSYGKTTFLNEVRDVTIVSNFLNAVDTVRSGGSIVCRSTLTSPANGCVPLNPFGEGSSSVAAIAYTTGDILANLRFTQLAIGTTLNGEPFSTWAGPVSLAVGAEYREQDARQVVDSLSGARRFMLLNPQPFSGKLNVKEAFAEVVVPVARDAAFAQSIDLNGAVRYTDYSTSGEIVAWKIGATWTPVDGITARVTRSRDVRAPNLIDLFQAPTQQTAQVRDPRTSTAASLIGGNPALNAESQTRLPPAWCSSRNGCAGSRSRSITTASASTMRSRRWRHRTSSTVAKQARTNSARSSPAVRRER